MRKFTILVIAVVLFNWISLPGFTQSVSDETLSPSKNVLFISSYSPSFETFFNQVNGLKSVFDAENITLDIEFMDTKRFFTQENYEIFHQSISYKLENSDPYDLIIVGDDNALNFVVDYEELFEELPIIFLGINDVDFAKEISLENNMTGIYESVSLKGTLDLARALKPDANRVVALFDNTTTSNAVKKQYVDLNKDYELPLEAIDLSTMTFDNLKEALHKLTDRDIVLFVSLHRDVNATTISFKEGLSIVFENLDQPVFCLYDFGLDNGLIGGEIVSFYEQGKTAAETALRIFNGANIDEIKVIENTHHKVIDYAVATEYNLDLDALPDDVTLINKEESPLMRYLPYLIAGAIVIVLQTAFIIYLRNNIRQRKRVESELLLKKQELTTANDELAITNEEMLASNEELVESNDKLSKAIVTIEAQKAEIYQLIYMDDLTKLNNRVAMTDLIRTWIKVSDEDQIFAILFMDVDNFKLINDTFGHDFGDLIILETGKRLADLSSKDVAVGRFGGDEFLLVLKATELDQVHDFLKKLEGRFVDPFSVENRTLYLTISVGVALYPLHGLDDKDLIKKADMALYEAKLSGKNRSIIYQRLMTKALEDKVVFQSYIRNAFSNNEFYLHYQPYYDLNKKTFVGAESLIRWVSPEIGRVSPMQLIEASEEMGLIVEIGKWIIRESLLVLKKINMEFDANFIVSINISPVQLMHPNFYDDLKSLIDEIGVSSKNLCLEMTETTLLEHTEVSEAIIRKAKELGLKIALDDFGTGYSSLSYFKNIPAEVIKIDKLFIDHIVENEFDRFTAKTIIELAHHKGLEVVAEGVESEHQVQILTDMNCDTIQGYYFSKPVSSEALMELLTNR